MKGRDRMDKDKFKEEYQKLMKNKKFFNLIIIVLVVLFLLLASSSLNFNKLSNKNNLSDVSGTTKVNTGEATMNEDLQNYENTQKEELKKMLQSIDGVGNVEVMIYFESGETKVPAVNDNKQTSNTEEKDTNGGTRLTEQETGGSTIVMQSDSNGTEPFITKVYKPQITGVLIAAEGAESSKLRYDIQEAVSSLYNISLDKVNVYPMKR